MSEKYIGYRDAEHIPFCVVRCKVKLLPAEKVCFRDGNWAVKWDGHSDVMWHGVADPFGEDIIEQEKPFKLYIRKECFHGLTHHFMITTNEDGGTSTCHNSCNVM